MCQVSAYLLTDSLILRELGVVACMVNTTPLMYRCGPCDEFQVGPHSNMAESEQQECEAALLALGCDISCMAYLKQCVGY